MRKIASFLFLILILSMDSNLIAQAAIFSTRRMNENNNAIELHLGYSQRTLHPEIFLDENLNLEEEELNLSGGLLGISKSFAFGDSAYFNCEVRGSQSTYQSKIPLYLYKRKSQLDLGEFLFELGFNNHSFQIDNASLHPFLGVGYFQQTLKDIYVLRDNSEVFTKIIEKGPLVTFGFKFVDEFTGYFSIIRAEIYNPSAGSVEDQTQNDQGQDTGLAPKDDGVISILKSSSVKAWQINLEMGIKF